MPDFRALLATAGVSRPWLARTTGRARGTIDRWCNGTAAPPREIVAWLNLRIGAPPPRAEARTPRAATHEPA